MPDDPIPHSDFDDLRAKAPIDEQLATITSQLRSCITFSQSESELCTGAGMGYDASSHQTYGGAGLRLKIPFQGK